MQARRSTRPQQCLPSAEEGPGRNDQPVRDKNRGTTTRTAHTAQQSYSSCDSRPVAKVSMSSNAFWVVHGQKAPISDNIWLELRVSPPSSSASSRRRGLLWASRAPARSSLNKVTAATQNSTALIAPTTTHTIKRRICSPVMVLCNRRTTKG